jgi:lysophospholipase L1-like esterase
MRPSALLFWILFALLAPLMLLQALWVGRRARRLPAGSGAVDGVAGEGPGEPLELLFVGESPVAGVGCTRMDEAVAARTAMELAQLLGRPVHWHAAGVNGIRIAQTRGWLLPKLPQRPFDLIVAVHGVNDTTGLTTLPEWKRHLSRLAEELHAAHGGTVCFSQVAPMHLFTALPQPLRWIIGLRARLLDDALLHHPDHGHAFHVPAVEFPLDPAMLAEDGYHPSAAGHAFWGRGLARQLLPFVRPNT